MSLPNLSNLTEEELRLLLTQHGMSPGPLGPSTRKTYENKLLRLMEREDSTPVKVAHESPIKTNGNSAEINNPENASIRRIVFEEENVGTPVKNKDDESDAIESDFEESVRILTPEEVIKFRSSFNTSPEVIYASSAKKISTRKTISTFLALLALIGVVVALLLVINWKGDLIEKLEL